MITVGLPRWMLSLLLAAVLFLGGGAVGYWKRGPVYVEGPIRNVPGVGETRTITVKVPGATRTVVVTREVPGYVTTHVPGEPIEVPRPYAVRGDPGLLEIFPSVITLRFNPNVRVRFGDQVVEAVLVGDPVLRIARISKDGEPPAWAPITLPDVQAPAVRVESIETSTRIPPPPRRIRIEVYGFAVSGIRLSGGFSLTAPGAGFGAALERVAPGRCPLGGDAFRRLEGNLVLAGSADSTARITVGCRW